ncbi:unnamed protein product [Mytilus edulis]|uniref:Uncharacterized protein n=1 Tax=Mytilus edulis TaxID=6550 RepID=A0A8S3VSJ0_MYTED|nr:unnamed protein product [Mytilus edulis]
MSKLDFEDLKDRLSIYMDSEESDTDEETKELVRKLKEVKKKEKVMKNKKRKVELQQEIEKRMKELEELEELELKGASKPKKEKSGKKVEQSKKGKIKGKSKDTDKGKDKDKDSVKDSKGDELSNLNIKHLRKDTKTKKIVDKHMKQMLATESNSESDSSISSSSSSDSSTGSRSEPIFLSSSDSDSETTHKKKNKHKKKKVRSGIKDRPHDKVKIKMNWPQSELKYEFTNRKAVEFRQLTMSQFCAGELEIIRHCKISKKEREDSNETEEKSENDYLKDLRKGLWDIHDVAREKMKHASDRQKRQYDTRVHSRQYRVGDAVWIFNPLRRKGLSPKLQPYWMGPYIIR